MTTRSAFAGGLAALVTVSACATYKPAYYEPRLASPPAQPIEYDFALIDCRQQAGSLVEEIQISEKASAAGVVAAYGATAAIDSAYYDGYDDYDRRHHKKRHKGKDYDYDDGDDWEEAAALLALTAGIAAIAWAASGPPAEELDAIYRESVDHCLIDLGYDVIPPGYDFVGTYID